MEITELIKKVKENLNLQSTLKKEIETAEENQKGYELTLMDLQKKLHASEEEHKQLKEDLIAGVEAKLDEMNNNFEVSPAEIINDDFILNIDFKFFNKNYALLENEYLWSYDGVMDLESASADLKAKIYGKALVSTYLKNGEDIFNKDTFEELNKIHTVYTKNSTEVINKLVSLEYNKKISNLESAIATESINLDSCKDRLEEIDAELAKEESSKTAKLFNKIFKKKKAEKIALRDKLVAKIHGSSKQLEKLQLQLSDKSNIKKEVQNNVMKEINALVDLFNFVKGFKDIKTKLADFVVNNIKATETKIGYTERKLAESRIKSKEAKSILQINKRTNNDIVENIFTDEAMIDALLAVDETKIAEEDKQALKFIKTKYTEYLHGYVESFAK